MLGYARIIGLGADRARRGRAHPTYDRGCRVSSTKIGALTAPSHEREWEL
jgi:hypothetical protein